MMNRDTNSPFAISSRRVVNGGHVSGESLSGSSGDVNVLWEQPKYSRGDKKSTVLQCPGLYFFTLCWMLSGWKRMDGVPWWEPPPGA